MSPGEEMIGALRSIYLLNVTVHVLAAVLWVGGLLFLALVGAPVLRSVEPPALRATLFRDLGRRFRLVGWTTLAVLLATGIANLGFRRLLTTVSMGSVHFWTTPFGRTLGVKLVAVAAMLVVQALHDFRWGPASATVPPGAPRADALRRRSALAARVSAVLAMIIVIAAVRLARGG